MTLDLVRLRQVAEAAIPPDYESAETISVREFQDAFNPSVALALLDEVERLRKVVLNDEELLRQASVHLGEDATLLAECRTTVERLRAAIMGLPEWDRGVCHFCHQVKPVKAAVAGHAPGCVRKPD